MCISFIAHKSSSYSILINVRYFTLVNDLQWKVRRSLSHSLHEVAKILGPQITDSALLPAFDLFLKDLDEVRVGVVKNIASFLAVASPSIRETYQKKKRKKEGSRGSLLCTLSVWIIYIYIYIFFKIF
jgi:hypothetical protein